MADAIGLTRDVSMVIHRGTGSVVGKYLAAEAGWTLRRKLQKKYPEAYIWSGVTMDPPFVVLIRASKFIEVPETVKHWGNDYTVQFLVRENEKTPKTKS
jgi:hypothetical protein